MNPGHLAKAIVHWLEFERLCERGKLITESSLKFPLHNYLSATTSTVVELEVPIQGLPANTGRKKSIDFVLTRPGGQHAWQHAIESKFVTDKRSFLQEVFDDIFRLDWISNAGQDEPFERWLLLAGTHNHLHSQVFDVEINPGGGAARIPAFGTILSRDLQQPNHVVQISTSQGRIRQLWRNAAHELGQNQFPTSMRVILGAAEPAGAAGQNFVCYIWRVTHQQNRNHHPI